MKKICAKINILKKGRNKKSRNKSFGGNNFLK
jgi:hypothetical protein